MNDELKLTPAEVEQVDAALADEPTVIPELLKLVNDDREDDSE